MLGGWGGIFRPNPVNVFDEPRALPSREMFHYAEDGKAPASEWKSLEEQQRFLRKYGAPDLDFYVDKKGDLSADLGIFTSPNTVLINRHGQEIGRIRGSAEWDDDDVIEYIYKIKAQHNQ